MYGVLHGVCSCPATPYCQVLTLIVKAILAAYGVLTPYTRPRYGVGSSRSTVLRTHGYDIE